MHRVMSVAGAARSGAGVVSLETMLRGMSTSAEPLFDKVRRALRRQSRDTPPAV